MKKLYIGAAIAIGTAAFSQTGKVGINEIAPQATLDIKPNSANAGSSATTNEGVLIPRLAKARVTGIATANRVEGTLVYVTDNVIAGDSAAFTGIGKGFYSYDSATSRWVKVGSGGYTAGSGVLINTSNVISRTGLEEITENGITGWALIGRGQEQAFGNTGLDAITFTSARDHQGIATFGSTGTYSFSTGYRTKASGNTSTAIGSQTVASGNFSFVSGSSSSALGDSSTAIGISAQAQGFGSFSFGKVTKSFVQYETAMGHANFNTDNDQDTGSYVANNLQLFSIGNGISGSSVDRSNALIVLRNGMTGINLKQSKPTEMLDVNGDIRVRGTGTAITVGGTCTNLGTISFFQNKFYGCTDSGWVLLNN